MPTTSPPTRDGHASTCSKARRDPRPNTPPLPALRVCTLSACLLSKTVHRIAAANPQWHRLLFSTPKKSNATDSTDKPDTRRIWSISCAPAVEWREQQSNPTAKTVVHPRLPSPTWKAVDNNAPGQARQTKTNPKHPTAINRSKERPKKLPPPKANTERLQVRSLRHVHRC